MAQSSHNSVNEHETNSHHEIEEAETSPGKDLNMNANICHNSGIETKNKTACKKYTNGEECNYDLSSTETPKLMRFSAEYEDLICTSSVVGRVNSIIQAYTTLLEQNKSDTGENKPTRQSIEDLTKYRETHPDFSVKTLTKFFDKEKPPQVMIASSSRTNKVDYSKAVETMEKRYRSFENEDVVSHGRVIKYLLEINKYGRNDIVNFNENQNHKTLGNVRTECSCNVHVFNEKTDGKTKVSGGQSSMRTLNKHLGCLLIDDRAHEPSGEINRKKEMPFHSSADFTITRDVITTSSTRENVSPKEECCIHTVEHNEYGESAQKIELKVKFECSKKVKNEYSDTCINGKMSYHSSNDSKCLHNSAPTRENHQEFENEENDGHLREIELEIKIACSKEMESSLREVLNRLSLFSALNPYNYFLLAYITTMVLTSQAENIRLLRKSILEECWSLTLAILDKIRRYLVDKLNICQEHLLAYFESLLLSMFITSSAVMNRVTFRK